MASMQKRLQKELLAFQNDPPPGMTLDEKSVQNSITQWIVDMEGAPGTLYEGEKFQLLFKFSSRYPFDSPQVMFTGDNIPVHPHVYSNGHICLSILTEDWSPALSVQSVCLSIISMLSSCKEKRRPPDNSFYVRTCNKNPKKTKWWYHAFVILHPELQLAVCACLIHSIGEEREKKRVEMGHALFLSSLTSNAFLAFPRKILYKR
ncbi:ubiquitin-conjugating enzyme E2 W isoform X1 [Prinia subflava]|uniref:ubiquitin-conjugating enzyme E2 W isoform X1 n=2 Tax=Prinia subflava TaxID=208062 RepID=UPI002FDFA81F